MSLSMPDHFSTCIPMCVSMFKPADVFILHYTYMHYVHIVTNRDSQ